MAFAKAKERMAYEQIIEIEGCEKLKNPERGGSETEADEFRQNARKLKLKRSRSDGELRQHAGMLKLERSRCETGAKELRQNGIKLKVKIDSKLKIRPHQNTESDDKSGNSSNQLNMASTSDGTALERIKTMSINSLPSSSTSQPKPLDSTHNTPTPAASITNVNRDLDLRKMAVAKAKEGMAYEQIIKACEKLEKLERRGSETGTYELGQNAMKLKMKIDLKLKIYPHQNTESNDESTDNRKQLLAVERASKSDGLKHELYGDPKFEHIAIKRIKVSFLGLPVKLKLCLLCFLKFPEKAIIKKRCLIYWWIGMGILPPSMTPKDRQTEEIGQEKTAEDFGNMFFDQLIAKGFIRPFYKKCCPSLDDCWMRPFLDGCWMHPLVHSVLTTLVNSVNFNRDEFRCWLNVDTDVIDNDPQLLAEMKHIKILYLGRWQQISTEPGKDENFKKSLRHIEFSDTNFFNGLKNMEQLRFLCLRGISLITEIPPEFILQLTSLMILDLRACYNLEGIPDNIGLLKNLTHLDMSECYFLNHMPVSLASLSELQVLKGFVIGDTKGRKVIGDTKGRKTCTLDNLTALQKLRKLNIYTTMKNFPRDNELRAFKKFKVLRKLTISWGGSSSQGKQATDTEPEPTGGLPLQLEKLDLQGFPGENTPSWLRPANRKQQLKKLYIRGGQLRDLKEEQVEEDEQGAVKWGVRTLRLKYLSELAVDWTKVKRIFPELKFAEVLKCLKLTGFPSGNNGLWIDQQSS